MSILCAAWPPNRSLVVQGVVALSWLLACGCSDDSHRLGGEPQGANSEPQGANPPARAARSPGLCANGAKLETLDQMEDNDDSIDMIAQRGGVWSSFNDESGTQFPDFHHAEVFPMSELDPPRSGSHFAARSYGDGFNNWGAGIGFELYSHKAYDLSPYAGITFWARRAPDTDSLLRFAVADAATTPRGGQCNEAEMQCNDFFGNDLTLSTTFQRYSFTWDELTQRGWSQMHPAALDTSEVYGVRFQVDPDEDAEGRHIRAPFDFWIDDVALLCHPD